jgi:hypothetical protein
VPNMVSYEPMARCVQECQAGTGTPHPGGLLAELGGVMDSGSASAARFETNDLGFTLHFRHVTVPYTTKLDCHQIRVITSYRREDGDPVHGPCGLPRQPSPARNGFHI